ncbi:MAG: hypothetical protein SNJ78_04590 [Spirochaetales bacterium]
MAEKVLTEEEITLYLAQQPKEKQKELLRKANALRGRETKKEKTVEGALNLLKQFSSLKKGDKVTFQGGRGGTGTGVFQSLDVYCNVRVGNKIKKVALTSIKK